MIITIHQPHFLPWMGYLNKVLHSQSMVWLNTVQYRKNYFQNRTRIKNVADQPLWLTLPVHARHDALIHEVTIADRQWRSRVFKTVEQCYRRTEFYSVCWPPLAEAMSDSADSLDEINYRTFLALLSVLDVKQTNIVPASELAVEATDPTVRLVELCRLLGATHYIAGRGGQNYMQPEMFQAAGIEVIFQSFDPEKVVYDQPGKSFLPGLSVIDCLFNEGPQRTVELIRQAWVPQLDGHYAP